MAKGRIKESNFRKGESKGPSGVKKGKMSTSKEGGTKSPSIPSKTSKNLLKKVSSMKVFENS